MTNDYKEVVLKYITGNLEEEVSSYDPQYQNIQKTTNNLYTQIASYFSSRVAYVDFIPSKNNKSQDLEYSVIACRGTLIGEEDESGAFVILDKEYNIVDVITHYSDGSLIGILYCLNVDDKGNYYAVEYSNNRYRIVLLNNIVLKPAGSNTYKAIVIDSHLIPNQYSWESMLKVFKNDGNNKYFVVGNRNNSAGMVGCELSIEDTDTWVYYTTTYEKQSAYAIFDNGFNVYWDSNSDLNFQIAVNNYGLVILTKGTGSTMIQTRYIATDNQNQNGNFIFYSNKIGYYAFCEDKDPYVNYYIYKIDLDTKENQIIQTSTGNWSSYSAIWLFKNKNSIYYDKIELDSGTTYNLSFGLIDDISSYEVELGDFTATYFLEAFCYPNVITEFNKNYVFIQNQDTLFSLDFIWNPNNYNGLPYTSSASLVPNTITIEDENEKEIFNRNIYNLSNYSNWYTASVLIPPYFLNNVQLYNTCLYSKANNLMASGNIDTTKNIYEEVNINFTNQFNIIDNDSNFENITASTKFVSSMLGRTQNRYIGKIRINYDDNTTSIKTISKNELIYTGLSTTYKIVIFVDKKINTIDLISLDEYINYKTIECSQLEQNKYYLITQDLRIE